MDVTITVRVCDECKRQDRAATRYTLTVDEGEPTTRDLCDEDAAPVLVAFGKGGKNESEPKTPAQRKAPAKKAAEKAPAKKTTSRRRGTPKMTLEEIEARKAAAAKP